MRYPGLRLREQLRLGPTSAYVIGQPIHPALAAMLRVENWYADGLIVTASEVLLVESKMEANPGAIGQVLFYYRLGYRTPELAPYLSLPFVPVVLYAEDDDEVVKFGREMGCRVEIYTPSWIEDYLTQVQFRRRATASPGANVAPS